MTNRQLKAYIKDKYNYKVVQTKNFSGKYYLMRKDEILDGYCSVVGNKLYDKLSDIIDDLAEVNSNEW